MQRVRSRQSCPGGAYYVCQNGYKGCCSVDPCMPGSTCPDSTLVYSIQTGSSDTIQEIPTSAAALRPSASSRSATQTTSPISTKPADILTPTAISSSTSSTLLERASGGASSTLTRDVTTVSDLTCPSANGTVYTEANRNSYNIHCNQDNSFTSFSTVSIDEGGFTSCFGACDNVTTCAGFTFVGLDGGSCYLKRSMPDDRFSAKEADNYISVVRVNKVDVPLLNSTTPSTTSSPTFTSTPSVSGLPTPDHSSGPSAGVIAGGVVGGVAAIVLVLLAIALVLRRKRKRTDVGRAASKSQSFFGPVESTVRREDSSKGEVFAPFGGFYRGMAAHISDDGTQRSEAVPNHDTKVPPNSTHGGLDDAGPAQLDGTPIHSTSIREPPVNMVEMADTSPTAIRNKHIMPRQTSTASESPVLGRGTIGSDYNTNEHVGRQHIMSWNNYDDREAMRLPSTMSSGISPVVISPPGAGTMPTSDVWYKAAQKMQGSDRTYSR